MIAPMTTSNTNGIGTPNSLPLARLFNASNPSAPPPCHAPHQGTSAPQSPRAPRPATTNASRSTPSKIARRSARAIVQNVAAVLVTKARLRFLPGLAPVVSVLPQPVTMRLAHASCTNNRARRSFVSTPSSWIGRNTPPRRVCEGNVCPTTPPASASRRAAA